MKIDLFDVQSVFNHHILSNKASGQYSIMHMKDGSEILITPGSSLAICYDLTCITDRNPKRMRGSGVVEVKLYEEVDE